VSLLLVLSVEDGLGGIATFEISLGIHNPYGPFGRF